jgi:selenide,water dikinase
MAMTDITGFGLLGHLLEICEGSGLSAVIEFDRVPFLDNLKFYIEKNCIPGGTYRNWKSYGSKISEMDERQIYLLADPQTSGGLLIAADKEPGDEFLSLVKKHGLAEIGHLEKRMPGETVITVN